MAAETTVATAAIKGGAMLASGGLLAEAVIFSDHSYTYLAIAGAIVSTFGVIHEIWGDGANQYTIKRAIAELVKGFILGLLAIPFFYLAITEGIIGKITGIDIGATSSSFALIVSFALSWYTVPFFNWISDKVRRVAK